MKKLNKLQQPLVDSYREKIAHHAKIEEELYQELVEKVGYDSNWLFDYIFNNTPDDNCGYSQMVQDNLFLDNE
jgi:hypothetical protein